MIFCHSLLSVLFASGLVFNNTVKPVNKSHPRERHIMVFIDKWPLFGGYIILFNQGRVTEVGPLFTGWSLTQV